MFIDVSKKNISKIPFYTTSHINLHITAEWYVTGDHNQNRYSLNRNFFMLDQYNTLANISDWLPDYGKKTDVNGENKGTGFILAFYQ